MAFIRSFSFGMNQFRAYRNLPWLSPIKFIIASEMAPATPFYAKSLQCACATVSAGFFLIFIGKFELFA